LGDTAVKAQFIAISSQSAAVPVANAERHGVLGIAYDSELAIHSPFLTTLRSARKIQNKVVAFRGCAEWSSKQSVANWGGQDSSLTCSPGGVPEVWLQVTTPKYYNFKIIGVNAGGTSLGAWTSSSTDYLDSCTTLTMLPTSLFNNFVNILQKNQVLVDFISSTGYKTEDLLDNGGCIYNMGKSILDYKSLPPLSLTIQGTNNTKVTINLGASGYIQQQDFGGFSSICFMVSRTTKNGIILGTTFFEQFYIVLDQDNNRVGFGQGCSCDDKNSTMHPYLSSMSSSSQPSTGGNPPDFWTWLFTQIRNIFRW
jgi:hypothetical protein